MNVEAQDDLGLLLRRYRTAAGLTQEELAERTGVSARAISDIERGLRSAIYRHTALELAQALNLQAEEQSAFLASARHRLTKGTHASSPTSSQNIPEPVGPLLGRERELAGLVALLNEPAARLVTVIGPGGVGKTRLAIAAAQQLRRDGIDVYFVPLGALAETDLVGWTVSRAFGGSGSSSTALESARRRLADRQALIVLDTFEHLLDAAGWLAELLALCAGVRLLVTSRRPLLLSVERQFPLGPLTTYDAATGDAAHDDPSVSLFCDRARRVQPHFALDEETTSLVSQVCRRLGGLPLAIELAAARVRHMPLPSLLAQVEQGIDVLSGGPHDLPARQQTMAAAIDWSYRLLSAQEQACFRLASVFAGSFSLSAAAAVADTAGVAPALHLVSALLDQNLLTLAPPLGPEARYSTLDVIREFAATELAGHGEAAARERHLAFFIELAEGGDAALFGPDRSEWFLHLQRDQDNLRAAMAYALESSNCEAALRLTGALWRFWRQDGQFAEGRRWLQAALAVTGQAPPQLRLRALWGAYWLALHTGEIADVKKLSDAMLQLAEQTGDKLGRRHGLTALAMAARAEGRHNDAIAPLEESLDICKALARDWVLATSMFNLGQAVARQGQRQRGRHLIDEALALYRELGDEVFSARMLLYLGYEDLVDGDLTAAEERIGQALDAFVKLDEMHGLAEALDATAAVAAASGQDVQAADVAGAAEALRCRIGYEPMRFDREIWEPYLASARKHCGSERWLSVAGEWGRLQTLEEVRTRITATGLGVG